MTAAANLVEVAALVGDTARATMLAALMGGEALTATELAYLARVTRPTASGHLAKLVNARLLVVTRKRRFAYYRIASPLVAGMMESLKAVAAIEVPPRHRPRSAEEEAQRFARTCYDHLAGRVGVAVADALAARGHVVLTDDGGEVTPAGERFLMSFGADLAATAEEPPAVLPAVPRLERAPLSHQGPGRRRDPLPLHGARLVQAYARQPRAEAHAGGQGRPGGCLRREA